MKKLVLKKDVVEVLDALTQQSVMAGAGTGVEDAIVINTSTRPNTYTCTTNTSTVSQTVQRPPVTRTCLSQCQTSACC